VLNCGIMYEVSIKVKVRIKVTVKVSARVVQRQQNLYRCSWQGMTKYISGRTALTSAIVDITGCYLYNNGRSPL